jgi:hypothetical protein
MCDVPSIAIFCSESIGCLPGTASKFFLKLLVTISVAPLITGIIVHFRFNIRCISIRKLLYFNLLLLLLLLLLFYTTINLYLKKRLYDFWPELLFKVCTCKQCEHTNSWFKAISFMWCATRVLCHQVPEPSFLGVQVALPETICL